MESVRLPEPERMIDVYPHQLSGGQRQRIMIAAALVLDPVLLIADEPTTALDVTTQAQILKLIKELRERRNTGVLFITHDFGVVAEVAHRVVVMQHGRVVEQGRTEDVLRRPRDEYTRMLIRSVPSLSPPARAPITGTPIVLQTSELNKTYISGGFFDKRREVQAANDVNLSVRRGETLGVVGESGSGKSTVARCIARLIEPTDGAILIEGADVAKLSARALRPHRKRVQIVFQDPYRSLNPRRTVGAAITEGPINFGMSEKEALERAKQLMRLVGLDPDALERFPHQFSGGQRQRICIARALAMEPEILVADEPVSALDVSVQAQVLELIDDVRKRFNLAVLFITHDLRVAAQVCDRIAVMHKGEVVEEGSTAAVFARRSTPTPGRCLTQHPGAISTSGNSTQNEWRRPLLPRHLAVAEQEVARLRQRLVALEAGRELGVRVGRLGRREGLIFPFAVADVVGILGAPALALLHHRVAENVGLDEAAVRVLLGVSVRAELGAILHQRDDGAVGHRLTLLGGVDRGLAGVEFAVLLVVRAIDGRVEHALVEPFRKLDQIAARPNLRGDCENPDADQRRHDRQNSRFEHMSPPRN